MPSRQEFRRRYRLLQELMAAEGLAALVLVSNASAEGRGFHRYLTNIHLTSRQALGVLLPGADPIILAGNKSMQWRVRQESGIEDVRITTSSGAEVANILASNGIRSGSVGIAGLETLLRVGDYLDISLTLPDVILFDVTEHVEAILVEKSPEELDLMRESGAAADAGLEAFTRALAVGVTQFAAVAEVERVMRARGSYDTLMLMSSGPTNPFLDTPSDRVFAAGDSVICSVEVEGRHGYWIERAGMYSFGEPSELQRRLYDSCLRSLQAAAAALVPGNTAAAVARAAEDIIAADGFQVGIWSGHGIGLNVIEGLAIGQDDHTVLREGMTVALHPHVKAADGLHSAYLSETFGVSANGGVSFSTVPHEFVVVG
ncbi:MAG: aminopeptidase P family protein [Chloroflexi bacterium]|nr:aminopeptidase P family protein [Chloroflexota bacterium]